MWGGGGSSGGSDGASPSRGAGVWARPALVSEGCPAERTRRSAPPPACVWGLRAVWGGGASSGGSDGASPSRGAGLLAEFHRGDAEDPVVVDLWGRAEVHPGALEDRFHLMVPTERVGERIVFGSVEQNWFGPRQGGGVG